MNEKIGQILTDPELVAVRQAWEQRLRELFDGHIFDPPLYLWGRIWTGKTDMYEDPAKRVSEALEEIEEKIGKHRDKITDETIFRPAMVGSALHGVHFTDKIFGADVYELDGRKDNWQVNYLTSAVGSLERPDLETNATWAAAKGFAQAFVDSGATFPVLQLPTIGSVLNTALNLYGQEILVTMMIDPAAVHHDLDIINDITLDIHDWYRANVPHDSLHQVAAVGRYQPPGSGQLCGCSTQLISAEQYREFVAAYDDALLSRYPNGGMIHLCGSHTQHIDTWREMKSLTSLQLNDRASEDLEIYLEKLPEKVYYVLPFEGMPLEKIDELAKHHKIVICSERAETEAG
jgi:hypothetical protein